MEQNLNELLSAINEMIKKGQIVEATEKFFAPNVRTIDFDGTIKEGKADMVEKMIQFASAIKEVKEITLHHSASNRNVTFAEFTFHFDMKDGSTILWHEILRSVWEDGQIIKEQYFNS